MKKLPLLLALLLGACTTTEQAKLADFMKSPAGQAIIHVATAAATQALDQAASTGKVHQEDITKAALGGASAELRKLQTPGATASPAEAKTIAKTAINEGTGVPAVSRQVAPAVSNAVADAVKNQNAPVDLALEAAARGLDQAVANKK